MLTVEKIDPSSKSQIQRFIRLPYWLYAQNAQWVPPLLMDMELYLDNKKHPYYEHSDAEFFIAVRDGEDVGRITAMENKPYNAYHKTHNGQFYFFECVQDQEVANALFERVFEWCRQRKLDTLIGPKGFGVLDGYGILVDGFEHRQIMNMMNYNFDYYPPFVEKLGFEKEVDFVSCYANIEKFGVPERIHRIAERVRERGVLQVQYFKTKNDMKVWAKRIGKLYNDSFINNWEYAPMTEREINFILQNLLGWADPHLIKIITHNEEAVGFLFGFPDVSASFQRIKGKLLPFGIIDVLLEVKRTDWIAVNGTGILPEFQGRGGNALMYDELERTVRDPRYHFKHADMTQVAETAVQMRNDLVNLGGKMYKNHRVYRKKL